jgi:hypothetical protein
VPAAKEANLVKANEPAQTSQSKSRALPRFVIAVRFGVPAALIIAGMLTIAGCIYIPVPEHPRTTDGKDVGGLLGPEHSDKPIRPGLATRDLVLAILGKPDDRTDHDIAFAYKLNAITGRRFGLCVSDPNALRSEFSWAPTDSIGYFLLLKFDRQGVLRQYQLERLSQPEDGEKWRQIFIELSNKDRAGG